MKTLRTLLTLLAVLAPIAWIAHVYPTLPAVIPNHYDSHGIPHRFAGKSIVWLLAAISAALALAVQIVSRIPKAFNLPVPVGDPRRPRLEALGTDLLSWISLEIVLMFDLQIWAIVHTAQHHGGSLATLLTLPIVIIAATAAWYILRMRRLA